MRLRAPWFWNREPGPTAAVLSPLAHLYAKVAASRAARTAPYRSKLPVICVGNFTAGGGGKTPTAIAIGKLLQAMGERPCFLTRGYGGKVRGPHLVNKTDNADEVGDEPLLLAQHAPTVVCADRQAGAKFIEGTDASVIVMDDGFQNPQLTKDFSLVVVDGAQGIGNGKVLPAGPLRAPLDEQMARADAVMLIDDGERGKKLGERFGTLGKAVLGARIAAQTDTRWLSVLPVIGFAGIARPAKFFATLRNHGARVIDERSYPDHYRYSERQARSLLNEASRYKAMLVTTEKDWVRLPEDRETKRGELKFRSRPLPIGIVFEDESAVKALLLRKIAEARG
jgi:tetraacyldisaccharide 4'-kinase